MILRTFASRVGAIGWLALESVSAVEVRPIPPAGIAILDADRAELTAGVVALGSAIEAAGKELGATGNKELTALLPDVQVFHKAVDWALRYGEFFDLKQIEVARELLAIGLQRASDLRAGKAPWTAATGLVVRGYRSKIDGSVQPYGMVVPDDWTPADKTPRRLDFWFRGRAEKSTELGFINDRLKDRGEFTPPGAFVLHPFGRFCNANKFAGERDVFEAFWHAQESYRFDRQRLAVRGFSMGGASTWQLATHFAGYWAAAAPGAGFAETAEFFKSFAPDREPPPWWEQVLWRWYDSTTMAANLVNVPTIAYSGELDGQKQAADIMIRFAEREGVSFPHLIGPQTAHKYHPEAKPKIEEFVTAAVEKGHDLQMRKGHWTTYSLMYPAADIYSAPRVVAMEKEWERAEIDWDRTGTAPTATTHNIRAFTWAPSIRGTVIVDGQPLELQFLHARALGYLFTKEATGRWKVGFRTTLRYPSGGSCKQPGLCGPIDHAFMSRFLFVRPTGKPINREVGAWVKAEMEHAQKFWRQVFRGDAPIKDDTAITADDLQNANLVLWGDPSSNAVLKKIAGQLPIKWTKEALEVNGVKYDAAHHAPILIFPNPLNPERYIVINSGPTFREQALLNNSDQTPKLPDWAVVDLRTPPDERWPGLVIDAGFFDEQWRFGAANQSR